eukprot:1146680-Pelagomonas_calceolata.AAC.1
MLNLWAYGRLAGSGLQKLSKDLHSTSHCLPRPTDTAGLPKLFVWRVGKVSGRVVHWTGQGDRRELYRKTGKPRGSRLMNWALPKNH